MRRAVLIAAAIALSACNEGAPTLDTSSDEAMKASIQRMAEHLPEDKKQALSKAVVALTLGAAVNSGGILGAAEATKQPNFMSTAAAPLKGKSADEIIKIADEKDTTQKTTECETGLLSVSSWSIEPIDSTYNRLTVAVQSHASKAIRMIDASVYFRDALGGQIGPYGMSRDVNISPGGTFTETNRWGPYTFERLLSLRHEEVTPCVRVRAVLYEDGTKEQF